MSRTIVILQPGYLPWVGYFDLLYKSDIFVVLDDVQYTTRDWRSRNRIKTPHGLLWYTVPVTSKGVRKKSIREVKIDNMQKWQRKQLRGFESFYKGAVYFDEIIEMIHDIYARKYRFLIDIDMDFIHIVLRYLSIERQIVFSSDLRSEGVKDERILSICKFLEATCYLSGNAAAGYLRESIFREKGIPVEWHNYSHPYYNQLWVRDMGFISHLSVLDLLFNHGRKSLDILTGKKIILPPNGMRIRNANDIENMI